MPYISQSSFAGGEISPEMYGRNDYKAYSIGLATCENAYIRQSGSVSERSGTYYIATAKYPNKTCRLIPFEFSTAQAYVLEFGDKYIRFYTNGAPIVMVNAPAWSSSTVYVAGNFVTQGGVQYYCLAANTNQQPPNATYWVAQNTYEIPSPYVYSDLPILKYTQSADTLYLCHPNYHLQTLVRQGQTNWVMSPLPFINGPFRTINTTSNTLTVAAVTGNTTLTATSAIFQSGHVGSQWKIVHNLSGPQTTGNVANPCSNWDPTSDYSVGNIVVYNNTMYICINAVTYDGADNNPSPDTDPADWQFYVCPWTSAIIKTNTQWQLVTHGTWTGILKLSISYDGGNTWIVYRTYSSVNDNNIIDSDTLNSNLIGTSLPQIKISMPSITSGTCTYALTGLTYSVSGIVQITAVNSGTSANVTVLNECGATTATKYFYEGAWSVYRGYPSVCTFFENRLILASTPTDPNVVWGSKVGAYNDFGTTVPTELDTDALTEPLIAREVNAVRSMIGLNNILAFTDDAEWCLTGNGGTVTPTNFQVKKESELGANYLDPIGISIWTLFCQGLGSRVRDLYYQWQYTAYKGDDLTLLARHLFAGYQLNYWCLAKAPENIIWIVRSDGVLLGLTYLKEEQIYAWHHHTTQGSFESVAAIPSPDNTYTQVWIVVNRTINGSTVRYIEMFAPSPTSSNPADPSQFFVDCGLSYNGTPQTSFSGLNQLVGQTVAILADGNVLANQVVSSTGTITLKQPASVVNVGLPFTATLETLPALWQSQDGSVSGRYKKIKRAGIRFLNSRGIKIGPSLSLMTEIKTRGDIPYGVAEPLYTDVFAQDLLEVPEDKNANLFIQQTYPLPMTILEVNRWIDEAGVL